MPDITVLMSVYNGAETLREAIDSVLSQTFSNWEMVIIDDCSTDNSRDIISEYVIADERIKLICNNMNSGLPKSLNNGLKEARGEFISRLDSDDRFSPSILEKQLAVMRSKPELAVLAASYLNIDYKGNPLGERHPPCGSEAMRLRLLFSSPFAHVGTLIRCSILKKNGGYSENEEHRYAEDWELWTRIIEFGEIDVLDEVLFDVRRGESLTVVHNDKARDCGRKIMKAYVRRFMAPAMVSEDALERFWRAYMFRDWKAVQSGDIKKLAALWIKLSQQSNVSALSRRFFSVAVHIGLKRQLVNAILLAKVACYFMFGWSF